MTNPDPKKNWAKAPVVVQTRLEACWINESRVKKLARDHGELCLEWVVPIKTIDDWDHTGRVERSSSLDFANSSSVERPA